MSADAAFNTLTATVLTFQAGPDTCATARTIATDAFTKLAPA